MDEAVPGKVQLIVGTHTEDAVTFWAQGKAYLHNVVYEKQIRILIRATSKDDSTTLVQIVQGNMDVGDEIAKMGFAKKGDPAHSDEVRRPARILRSPSILWARRNLDRGDKVLQQGIRPKLRPVFPDQIPPDVRERSTTYQLQTESLLRKKIDKTIPEETEKLDADTCISVQNSVLLESQLKELKLELQASLFVTFIVSRNKVKEESQQQLEEFKKCIQTAVGSRLKGLAEKVEVLRTLRQSSSICSLGDDLLEAIRVVTQDCISPPETMEELMTTWTKYNLAQEMLQSCKNEKGELEELIARRNEARETFSAAVDEYLLEVDGMSITQRMNTLEEQDNEDCKIVSNAFSKVMQKLQQEQKLLCTVQEKYIENTQLNFPNHKFITKADGVPDTGELDMDPDLRSLLSKLLTCKDRLVSAEVLEEDYFLHTDVVAEAECADTMKPEESHTEASQDC
ncbi:UNVERIFIED_CONTAM: hypothetical protein FKN15_028236 [Acipenser sinensis]